MAFHHILNWFRHDSSATWVNIERNIVSPIALKEVVFTHISLKQSKLHFGHIIALTISICGKI